MSTGGSSYLKNSKCGTISIIIVVAVLYLFFIRKTVVTTGSPNSQNAPKSADTTTTFSTTAVSNINPASRTYHAQPLPNADPRLPFKTVDSSLFPDLIKTALNHPRKRRMSDLTKDPPNNSLQVSSSKNPSTVFTP